MDGFLSPTIITTEDFRPDLVITTNTNIYIVELTVGFETNIRKNEERKQSKYTDIINNLSKEKKVLFVNLSMGACGVVGKESGKLFSMLKELGMNEMESHFLIRKLMNVCIRATYFIFCKGMGRSGPFGMVIVLPQYFTSPVQPLMPLLSE